MKWRDLAALGGISLAALGTAMVIKSALPRRFLLNSPYEKGETLDTSAFPDIDVTFLRCGSITIPEFIAVRGAFSLAPRTIAHSAVLIQHPKATFLYDTGLCSDIALFLIDQSLFFRKTLANFTFEQSLVEHLEQRALKPHDLDFALISHLHWDHVSGIPDIPGVPLRINRIEFEEAQHGLLQQHQGLSRRLMGNNPVKLFDCNGPAYEGFSSSCDLLGDGSIVLVPLAGHTIGNTGMFINRSNGSRLFLLGDAAWVAENYLRPATMHPFIWSRVTSDDELACQTLRELLYFSQQHPEIPMIAMHDARLQEAFMRVEQSHLTRAR